jgi:hypothetical protein
MSLALLLGWSIEMQSRSSAEQLHKSCLETLAKCIHETGKQLRYRDPERYLFYRNFAEALESVDRFLAKF